MNEREAPAFTVIELYVMAMVGGLALTALAVNVAFTFMAAA